jgi:hypothetical protein
MENIIKSYYSYTNNLSSRKEKIELEKRRRNQTYLSLDYFLSIITYFDFFSNDAFQILKTAKSISLVYKQKNVSVECLILSFFYENSFFLDLLDLDNLNKKNFIEKFLNEGFPFKKPNNSKNIITNFKNYFRLSDKSIVPNYSYEVNVIFEKAAEIALRRFKTPVITSEILFLTLLEENNNKQIKFLKKIIGNDLNWYLLKYKLIKSIHNQESSIREEVIKNQQFFAYLLKTQLTNNEFQKLLENDLLSLGVSLFRNTLISQLLQINLLEKLRRDIRN